MCFKTCTVTGSQEFSKKLERRRARARANDEAEMDDGPCWGAWLSTWDGVRDDLRRGDELFGLGP